jgi:hypothetical protein
MEDEAAFAVHLWHNITYQLGFDKYQAGCDLVSSGFYHRGWPYAIPYALGGCYSSSNPDGLGKEEIRYPSLPGDA